LDSNHPEDHGPASRLPKHLRVFLGFLLLVVGGILSLPLVPGPGIALIILGLVLLSRDFHWAARVLEWAKRKWQRLLPPK
jgi:uncharacterized membrane protein